MVRRHPGEGGCPIFRGALNALHTVTSPYARRIFGDLLGLPAGMVHHGLPLGNLGGVTLIPTSPMPKNLADVLLQGDEFCFGPAYDGSEDHSMLLGHWCFVNPSDSLAAITAHAHQCGGQDTGLPLS